MHTRSLSVLLVLILAFSTMPMAVNGDTVIRSEVVDLLPAGTFDNASEWELSTNKAYSTDPAEHSASMIADGRLSFAHNRPVNYNEITAWSTVSPSGDNLSIGNPDCFKPISDPVCDNDSDGDSDGGFSWTKGPIIELSGFDLSEGSNYEIANVSLSVAFRVPDSLQQDSVRIIVESGGTQHLIRTYAHTMGEVNHMNYNAMVYSLDSIQSWTWAELSSLTIMLDYVSVGEFDDTELQVDAAGLIVKHLQPWGTFELAQASHSVFFEEFPIIEINLTTGSLDGLSLSPCGLENAGQNSGTWVTSPLLLPHEQAWGRFHPDMSGNASWHYSTSEEGDDWSTMTPISAGEILQTMAPYIRFHGTLIDGCIEGLTVDINNPMLTIQGEIIGAVHSMVPGFATLRIAMNGEEVASHDITSSNSTFHLMAAIGHLLPPGGGVIEVGLSARFHWSSNGSSEDIVIQVESMSINGGFLIEWDRDPVCDGQNDQIFDEDGGGRLLDFIYTCSDDITSNADLVVTVSSADMSIMDANFVNGQVRLQPVADAHGETTVTITVMDERQNTWVDEIAVIITAIDDSPEMASLPVELTMEINEPLSTPFAYWDRDTPSNLLNIEITPEWAVFSAGQITFNPITVGSHLIIISVTDGTTEINQSVTIIATQQADVWVQSIGILDQNTGESSITEGNDIAIDVFVRNSGHIVAQPVTVRCSIDGQTIGTPQIAMIAPGGLETASCNEWSRLDIQSGEVTLEIEIDWTGEIDETNEVNNLWSTTITVQDRNESPSDSDNGLQTDSLLNEYNSFLWISVTTLGLLALLIFIYGPNQIRKVE
ncbi:MAG: hypothetical protein OSB33_04595 [Candidatus Poseidoniales archaeon]|nr:hypothetical protein [Candidatus Poseidoniales archaeon]